jgi:hypothetical protein
MLEDTSQHQSIWSHELPFSEVTLNSMLKDGGLQTEKPPQLQLQLVSKSRATDLTSNSCLSNHFSKS